MSVPEKIDLVKQYRELYTAGAKVKDVSAGKATFLSCEGVGEPGGSEFQTAIQQLYSLAYTLKFMLKNSGRMDFGIGKLECLWRSSDVDSTPKSEWRWQLLIRIPDSVTGSDVKAASTEVERRRQLDTSDVKLWNWKEGHCLQVMHIGPYGEVGKTYAQLDEYARGHGFTPKCPGHEIYINDPGRVAPAKLKTIVRMPVA
jgi:hypothetical protein